MNARTIKITDHKFHVEQTFHIEYLEAQQTVMITGPIIPGSAAGAQSLTQTGITTDNVNEAMDKAEKWLRKQYA